MKTAVPRLQRRGGRTPVDRSLQLGLAVLALAAVLYPTNVLANNDPHRTFLAATPFDPPAGVCTFPVHLAFPVNNEYGTISTAADGSTVITVTGSLKVTATNKATGSNITLNASGPATFTISPDGTTEQLDGRGLGLFFAPNGTGFGLPSGLVQTSGPLHATIDIASQDIITINRPHVLLDVCAALS